MRYLLTGLSYVPARGLVYVGGKLCHSPLIYNEIALVHHLGILSNHVNPWLFFVVALCVWMWDSMTLSKAKHHLTSSLTNLLALLGGSIGSTISTFLRINKKKKNIPTSITSIHTCTKISAEVITHKHLSIYN